MPPEGLLIDYGGVLTNPLGPVMTRFCRAHGLPDDAMVALQGPDSAFRGELEAYERGEYDDAQFLPRFAAALGLPLAAMDAFLTDVQPDVRMFAAVRTIRAHGIRTGLLSNSWGTGVYPRELLAAAFDEVVISGEVGMRKPEPRIYVHAARVLGLAPERCAFVDDTAGHLAAAAASGMAVVHHQEPDQTLRELEALFGVALSGAPITGAG
jgi:putative hydrolase of the HAD superfamily